MKSLILILATAISCASFGEIRALTHDMYGGNTNSWQLGRHNKFLKDIAGTDAKVVFLGDSITQFWESSGKLQWQKYFSKGELKAINLGISGDRTEHVLWRINEGGELDGYEAKAVVVMIGTNNSGHFGRNQEPVGDTVLAIREIVKSIRAKQPKAKIILCAIFPRGADMNDQCRIRNDLVNREIMTFADGENVFWCDFREQFLGFDGRLSPDIAADLLHPGAYGYELWASAVIPYLQAAVRDAPMPPSRYAPFIREQHYGMEKMALPSFPVTRIRSEGYGDFDWWLDRFARNREQIDKSNGEIDLVFAGDSITHFWEEAGKESLVELRKTYSVMDMGYSGDRTEHLLWRCENGELDGFKAKCIMLMIGTNNSWHRYDKPEAIAAGIRKIIDVMHQKQPQAKILLLPIFPFGDGPKNDKRINNEKVNEIIKGYADNNRVFWTDFNAQFLDEKGDMIKSAQDRCHPSAEAYKNVWLPAVLPYFQKFVGK